MLHWQNAELNSQSSVRNIKTGVLKHEEIKNVTFLVNDEEIMLN